MDLNKKVALLKWLDALSVQSVNNFEDLRDVSVITDILCTCGDLLPDKDNLNCLKTRLHSLRAYLEGCYHQSFEDGTLINFQLLSSSVRGDVYELEMGKLLLALLGCVIQDQARERFIAPALEMESQSQYELKEMIESVLFYSDTDTHLPADFAEVLKRKTESSSQRDAALFFKLVADGKADAPQWNNQSTPNTSVCHSVNDSMFAAMYSNSPQAGNTSGFNIREISSPLRGMSISSPVTPLGALMYSPQLAQKIMSREEERRKQTEALLRKKVQEYRRLDIEHQNEKHLRQELELDLEQCGQKIVEKDNKIRELERQLGEVRKLRDNQDELEALRMERERLDTHIKDLQARLNEQQTVREQNQMLEAEITDMMKEQKAARDELDMMNSVKKISENYRVESHKQRLTIKELETSLEHRNSEVERLCQQLEEVENMRQACLEKYNMVKKEKEELEELYGSNQGCINSVPVYSGESMNVVTEKRLSELQVEYDQIRSTWIDPVTHHTVCEHLKHEEHSKLAFEEQFTRTKSQLMTSQSDNEKLSLNLRRLETQVGTLESDLASSEGTCKGLETQVGMLQSSEESLQGMVRGLRQELSKLQTELMLTQQEMDDQKKVSEDRRMTIAHLDEVKVNALNSEQQLKQSEQTLKSNIRDLEIAIEKFKGENKLLKDEMNVLKEKVTHMAEDNSELTIKLEQERSINANTVKKLNSDLSEEKVNYEQVQSSFMKITSEYGEFRTKMNAKIEELTEAASKVSKEKTTVELEVRKLQLELNSAKEKSQVKYERLDRELTEKDSQLNQIVEELKRQNDETERKRQITLEELAATKNVFQEQSDNITQCNKTIDDLKSQNRTLTEELEAVNRKLVDCEHEIKSLQDKLMDEQETSSQNTKTMKVQYEKLLSQHNEEKSCFHQQLEETKSQIQLLKDECDSSTEQHSEEKTLLLKQIEDNKSEHESRMCEVKHEHGNIVDELKSEINTLNSATEELKNTHSEKVSELMQLIETKDSEKVELECSNTEKEDKIDSMSAQLIYLKDVEKSLKSALANLETDYETMKNLSKQREEVRKKLESVICDKDVEIEDLKRQIADIMEQQKIHTQDSETRFTVLDSEKNDLENKLSALEVESEAEISELKDKLVDVENYWRSQCEQLEEEYAAGTQELREAHAHKVEELEKIVEDRDLDTSSQKEMYQQKTELLEKALHDRAAEVENLKSTHATETDEIKNSLNDLNEKLRQLNEENEMYQQKTQVLEKALQDRKAEVENLKSTHATETDERKNSLNDMNEKLRQLNEENGMYQQKTQVLEKALHDWKAEVENLKSTHATETDERKNSLNELNEKLRQLNEENGMKLEAQRGEFEKQVKGFNEIIEDKEKTITKIREEYEQKSGELDNKLQNKLAEIECVNTDLLKEKSESIRLQNEKDDITGQLEKLRQEKNSEIEILIKQHEEKLEDLRNKLNLEHSDIIGKTNSSYENKLSELRSEIEGQRVNYQQMMCNMEEKLGGDVSMMKERLSQMKCQYETLIESKEKEIKKSTEDWQNKIEAIVREKAMLEQQCNMEREQNNKCQGEMIVLSSKVSEYERMLSESSNIQTELRQKLEVGTEREKTLETELAAVKEGLTTKEMEVTGFKDSLGHEKGEKEELCRQLEYIQERNDTLTGELSSQQQQLAAVEEEKRLLEVQISKVMATSDSNLAQIRQQLETEKSMIELEKSELERQLQSSQKCYDAVQKSETELKHQSDIWRVDMDRLQEKNRELEQRLLGSLEEERKLKEENQMQRDRCTELNNNLQSQIRQYSMLEDTNTKIKQEYEQNNRALREQKTGLEIENAALSKVEETLKLTEAERKKLEEHTDLYKVHYNKKKEIIAQQAEQIEQQSQELDYYKRAEQKLINDYNPMKDKLNMEMMKNKSLNNQVRTLETQLDYANRKLKDYKQELEKAASVYLGDPTDFNKMMAVRENCEDASFMENHPSSVPLNSSVFDKENDNTLTPGSRNSRARKRMSKSTSSCTVSSVDNTDTISIGSATSLAYRLRSRESAVSLNRSISSFDSCKSNVPRGTGGIFHCEDEPMELEWGRLGELSRRNTMCPSHLKTSYPVETQRYAPTKFQDDALRQSTMGGEMTNSGRKRKQGWDSADSGSDSADSKSSKQAKTGCVYHKPGPPTPANSRRSSKGSRSPNTRRNSGKGSNSRSPRTPLSLRGRRTPKRTPKNNTPKRSTTVDSRSNNGSGKKSSKRESVAFSVGFSPLSLGHSHRLTRQQAFIQKQPPSSSQTQPQVRKPLGTRNFLQTGL